MITALSEFVDFLYTRAATELPTDLHWRIELHPPVVVDGAPSIRLKCRIQHPAYRPRIVEMTCNFQAVEDGARAGAEELGIVADYYIRKFNAAIEGNRV